MTMKEIIGIILLICCLAYIIGLALLYEAKKMLEEQNSFITGLTLKKIGDNKYYAIVLMSNNVVHTGRIEIGSMSDEKVTFVDTGI